MYNMADKYDIMAVIFYNKYVLFKIDDLEIVIIEKLAK